MLTNARPMRYVLQRGVPNMGMYVYSVKCLNQVIPIVTLYSYLSILVGKISTVFLQILEYLLTDKCFQS